VEPIQLTDRFSMIVPVELAQLASLGELPHRLSLGRLELRRKAEHHVTVINYALGKHLKKACEARPGAREAIDAAAAGWDWRFWPGDVFFHLHQTAEGKPPLDTVVVMIEAPIARFYLRVRELLMESGKDGLSDVLTGLLAPPPPHVTLYTSDPEGKAGIGLNQIAELDDAITRAQRRDGARGDAETGLRAFRLSSRIVRGT
jgi:hypothetical protein